MGERDEATKVDLDLLVETRQIELFSYVVWLLHAGVEEDAIDIGGFRHHTTHSPVNGLPPGTETGRLTFLRTLEYHPSD